MNICDCAGCKYFVKHYGNKDKRGKRTVSNYWCVKKNGFIRSFPKKCLFKPAGGGRVMATDMRVEKCGSQPSKMIEK